MKRKIESRDVEGEDGKGEKKIAPSQKTVFDHDDQCLRYYNPGWCRLSQQLDTKNACRRIRPPPPLQLAVDDNDDNDDEKHEDDEDELYEEYLKLPYTPVEESAYMYMKDRYYDPHSSAFHHNWIVPQSCLRENGYYPTQRISSGTHGVVYQACRKEKDKDDDNCNYALKISFRNWESDYEYKMTQLMSDAKIGPHLFPTVPCHRDQYPWITLDPKLKCQH